jgi:asparagine synthase (glutamine-hydrolysing)
MCGIAGQIGPKACSEQKLLHMMGMLPHRGPDEAGLLMADGVALGHLRLSIIDLQSGQQPMCTHDRRYWVVFNGEIFNHLELRAELEALGHVFLTKSDTEVLLNSYRQWGTSCLERFNGQWAFALWDSQDNTFLLARDRWGVRPLFYSFLPDGQTMLFASEIKALLADERVSRQWDFEALRDIFICWASESDRTALKSIQQVPPGSYLFIKDGKCRICQWWEVEYSPDHIEWDRTQQSWCEEIRETLTAACKIRLRADVPVGAYLSGGLDSSIISLLTLRQHQNQLKTFSISFEDAEFDESHFQRMMAEHLGTDHKVSYVRQQTIAKSFKQAIWHTETPIYRTAPVPMMHLSRLARDSGITVVLTGEGSDELFGGYGHFKEDKIRRFWARNPGSRWRKRLLEHLESDIPRTGSRTRAFWYAFYQVGLEKTESAGYSHHIRWRNGMSLLPMMSDQALAGLFPAGDSVRNAARSVLDNGYWVESVEATVPAGFERWLPLSRAQYWETRQLLSGYLLSSQGDRMAMASSVEGRYPFLDVNVYELARRLPPDLKLRALIEKYILRKTFAAALPRHVVERTKNPYRAPEAASFFCQESKDQVLESFQDEAIKRRGLFDPEAMRKLCQRVEHSPELAARDNMAMVLAYSTHLFHDLFVEGKMVPSRLPPLRTRIDLTAPGVRWLGTDVSSAQTALKA